MSDPVTEACRRVREEIVQRSGGFDGYFDQLEALDRKRLATKSARHKKRSSPARKRPDPKRPA